MTKQVAVNGFVTIVGLLHMPCVLMSLAFVRPLPDALVSIGLLGVITSPVALGVTALGMLMSANVRRSPALWALSFVGLAAFLYSQFRWAGPF
jgi:hypothetical protein